jgi:hypothetical protein
VAPAPVTASRGDRLAELAEDQIITRWCAILPGGKRELAGWRFPCPCCGKDRRLSVQAKPGRRHPEWNLHCGCDRSDVQAKLAAAGLAAPLHRRRVPKADPDELAALALADMPPLALRLGLLELAGFGTREALDKLGVTRTNRYRVVSALRQSRRS